MINKKKNKSAVGKRARLKGLRNQRKTVKYMIDNPLLFGTVDPSRIYVAGSMARKGSTDLFGLWDIISLPNNSEEKLNLVQVKTNLKFPSSKMSKLIKELAEFYIPNFCRKFLVVWYDRKKKPLSIEITNSN